MIADFERQEFMISQCAWPAVFKQELVPILIPSQNLISSNTTAIPREKPKADSTTLPLGPVIGGVIGGLALLLASAVCFYIFIYKPRQRKKIGSAERLGSDSSTLPYGSAIVGQEPFSTDGKPELDTKQTFEMVGTPPGITFKRHEMDTYVPAASELCGPLLYEMPAREIVGTDLTIPSSRGDNSGKPIKQQT